MMNLDYELLDTGSGRKLERFGKYTISRPEKTAHWEPHNPVESWKPDIQCTETASNKYTFIKTQGFSTPWIVELDGLKFDLRLSESKNIGVFPEQLPNWIWLKKRVEMAPSQPNILNLFAYTGGATMACARAGAKVCHVDSSKTTVRWASENQTLNNLKDKPIRWIVDDVNKFLNREIKRGNKYDGIILDPPPFGRAGKIKFEFEKQIHETLSFCKQLLSDQPLFLLLNIYAVNLNHQDAKYILKNTFPDKQIESGTLTIKEALRQNNLDMSVYARFR